MPPNGEMMSGSIGRMERTGPISSGMSDCQTADVAGEAALDELLEDDVGAVEADLRPRVLVVVDLGGERRVRQTARRDRRPAQRRELRRRRSLVGRDVGGPVGVGIADGFGARRRCSPRSEQEHGQHDQRGQHSAVDASAPLSRFLDANTNAARSPGRR